jgi:4-diphosphocytidyl-2-C-methyl-D-erythritol kinase
MKRSARLKAFAKINLGLRVLYKRPDNYHEIRTVFQTISLADELDVEYSPAQATSVEIEGTPHIPDNLVERAARLVLHTLETDARVHFRLKKRIPAGAGLGGGSTDAAAVLLALPVLAGKAIEPETLHSLAAQLGSDVPFFLHGGTALGLGRGEELYPLPDRPATRALLVSPNVHSGTAEAYRDLSERLTTNPLQNKLFSFQEEVWEAAEGASDAPLQNDFEEGVFRRHPELGLIADRLIRSGAKPVAMTGSGSSIFGIFSGREQLARSRQAFPGEQTNPISFVSRSQYRSAWRRALKEFTQSGKSENGGKSKTNPWPPLSRYAQ